MRIRLSALLTAAACALLGGTLAGCGGDGADETKVRGVRAAVTEEAWCEREGLTPALRQTIVLIDERAIRPGKGAAFRTANPVLFDTINALGSAEGVTTGAMAPRERLSLYVVPHDGGAPQLLFTGCAPGLSREETAAAHARRSGVGDFIGGDLARELEEADEAYGRRFISFVRMGDRPQPPPVSAGTFARSSLLASLKSVRQLAREGAGVPRVLIFTDLALFPGDGDVDAARVAGFAAAREARLALGGAEVVLVGPGGTGRGTARQYASAFFLGSQGNLLGWGSGALASLPAAPVSVQTYAGKLRYPADQYPARMIIGRDGSNRLVNSWLIVDTDAEWATPVGGSLACSGEGLHTRPGPQRPGPAVESGRRSGGRLRRSLAAQRHARTSRHHHPRNRQGRSLRRRCHIVRRVPRGQHPDPRSQQPCPDRRLTMRLIVVTTATASLILSGCATTGGPGGGAPQTAMQRTYGNCLIAIGAGAVLGAIIGNNTGSGNARRGAGTGALAGVGLCGVMMAMASAEDRRRIAEAEYAALETGQERLDTYVGDDGKQRSILVRTQAAPDRSWAFTPAAADAAQPSSAEVAAPMTDICRYRQTTLSVEGAGTGALDQELVCRNPRTRAWEVQHD